MVSLPIPLTKKREIFDGSTSLDMTKYNLLLEISNSGAGISSWGHSFIKSVSRAQL